MLKKGGLDYHWSMQKREDELLESLMEFFRPHSRILVGPGHDTAVISEVPTRGMVLTVDAQVEGIHFRRGFLGLGEIGHRSLAAALSDLAPLGALPLTFLVNLEIPNDLEKKDVLRIYEGFKELSDEFCLSPVGGNLVKGTRISLVTTVVGEVPKERKILRSGAKPGDLLAVTGELGRVLAAFEVLQNPSKFPLISSTERERLSKKFRQPWPRIKEMQAILKIVPVTSAIDISDGLGLDLARIARSSGVEIRIKAEDIPISQEVERVAHVLGIPKWKIAVSSGEEFEIAFTFPKEHRKELEKCPFRVTVIGYVKECFVPDVIIEIEGEESVPIGDFGYDQLSGWKSS